MESGSLGFGIWNSTLRIRNLAQKSGIPQHLESVIQVPHVGNPESSIWSPESTAWNPGSKTLLVYMGRNEQNVRKLKQRRFWATQISRKWAFFIFGRWFCQNFQSNRPCKGKEAEQYKFISSRHIKRKKASLPVDVRRSKTFLLKLTIIQSWDAYSAAHPPDRADLKSVHSFGPNHSLLKEENVLVNPLHSNSDMLLSAYSYFE